MAIAVLPVWRSPMMSSRWPRPIGTMESMARIPVCIGSFTGWREITPGALNSTGRVPSALMGPLPSMGWPSGFTTRPSMALPAGTSTIRPVVRTWSFSLIAVTSPRSTAPTSSSSRFWARPYTVLPPSPMNSSSSPAMASRRPSTRAMPSPTWMTVPTSRDSTLTFSCSSCFFSASSMDCAVISVTSIHLHLLCP